MVVSISESPQSKAAFFRVESNRVHLWNIPIDIGDRGNGILDIILYKTRDSAPNRVVCEIPLSEKPTKETREKKRKEKESRVNDFLHGHGA